MWFVYLVLMLFAIQMKYDDVVSENGLICVIIALQIIPLAKMMIEYNESRS